MSYSKLKSKKIVCVIQEESNSAHLQSLNNNLTVTKGETASSIPFHRIQCVLIFGNCSITSPFIRESIKNNITVSIFDYFGYLITSISASSHNPDLKTFQYASKNNHNIATKIIEAKLLNQCNILKKRSNIELLIPNLDSVSTIEELLGYEGSYASQYYENLFTDIGWVRRQPRVKADIPNVLLDMGYMRLYSITESLVTQFGFDPYKGFLHKDYYSRKSLVCDFMEPFRPIVDGYLLSMYNLGQVREQDFIVKNQKYQFVDSKTYHRYSILFIKHLSKEIEKIYDFISDMKGYITNNN